MSLPAPQHRPQQLTALVFVLLYGAGFVGARLGLPHAEPFTFLSWRFALAALILAVLARTFSAPWPRRPQEWLHIATAGVLTVGVFSAGVFYSIACGLPPATSALIIALQPLLIGLAAPKLLGEQLRPAQWLGLLLALCGVSCVLANGFDHQAIQPLPIVFSIMALLGLSGGNLYQKAFCAHMHPFSGGAIQCALCAFICYLGKLGFERGDIAWTSEFILALAWMVLAVSVGAVSLLVVLIRHGEVSRIAGLFYLVPVSAALTAWLLFDQSIAPMQWMGIAITGLGVRLATRKTVRSPPVEPLQSSPLPAHRFENCLTRSGQRSPDAPPT